MLQSPVVKAWQLGSARAEAMIIICVNVILMVAAASEKIVRLLDVEVRGAGVNFLMTGMHVREIWWLGLDRLRAR